MEEKISDDDFLTFLRVEKVISNSKLLRRQYLRRIAHNLIGSSCKICGETQNVAFHQKYGKKHPLGYYEGRLYHYITNYRDFVSLCGYCHRLVHGYALVDITNPEMEKGLQKQLETKKEPQLAIHLILLLRNNK